jgi:hypothetical protein
MLRILALNEVFVAFSALSSRAFANDPMALTETKQPSGVHSTAQDESARMSIPWTMPSTQSLTGAHGNIAQREVGFQC